MGGTGESSPLHPFAVTRRLSKATNRGMATTAKVLLWVLGMFLIPPFVGFLTGAASNWANAGAFVAYGFVMIGMAVGAAVNVARSPAARIGLFFVFAVGMLFLQCAVFFVGCTILVSVA